jgi:hypothetical protein
VRVRESSISEFCKVFFGKEDDGGTKVCFCVLDSGVRIYR